MKLCPRSAQELGQELTEQQAREWCCSQFNELQCNDCAYARKFNLIKLSVNVEDERENGQQLPLFGR